MSIFHFLLYALDRSGERSRMDGSSRMSRAPTAFLKRPRDFIESRTTLTEHRLRGGRAKADQDAGVYHVQLRFEPWSAGGDLAGRRAFVFAAFALRFPFKVLDRIGHVDVIASDAGFYQGFVQYPARRVRQRDGLGGLLDRRAAPRRRTIFA